MSEYLITYRGGSRPKSPEEGAAHMQRYKAWVAGLGDAVVKPDTPVKACKIVSASAVSDVGAGGPMGFTIIAANDMDAALEIAKSCPFLEMDNASIELCELMAMH
jgi:hypothetical protein